jgi:hypothetical protein
MNTSCVGQLPVTITNTQENQSIKTKGLIWLTGFGGSTAWSPLLWACGEVAHHGQISQGAKLLTSWSGSKNGEEEEGAEVLGRGSKVHPPPVTGRLPTRTHLLKFPHRSPAPGAGGQAFLCRCTHGGHRGCRLQWFPWLCFCLLLHDLCPSRVSPKGVGPTSPLPKTRSSTLQALNHYELC